ncbi:MAG: gliding motility-associated C-terminal domain-containing protein [Crocinitomicaceae bacterium]|nr:gliding motility-associated C-terminal domain-containing protein [Crocinitomicaceae bacterium]
MKNLFIFLFVMSGLGAYAQFPGCPNIVAGPDQVLPCTQNCTTLSATPFAVGNTSTYTVSSIPHSPPIAYNAAGGTSVSVGTDDIWSPNIALPFPFCYYGTTYNDCQIGSNGSIDFGGPSTPGGYCPWSFSVGCPNAGLTAAGDIFGVYHDIDPSVAGTVKWYLQGTAPCRILVVSFNLLGHFSCTSMRSTHMIVLYETTNVIDVYINRKDLCTTWNGGNAIVGIQNQAGSAGMAAPGRNAPTPDWTVTTGAPEGWRFTPNGAPIYTVEWVTGAVAGVGGTVIGTGNTINVCPNGVTTTYTARVTYTRCDGLTITDYDDIVVSYSSLPAPTVSTVAETCAGYNNGSVTINNAIGSGPYTVSIAGPASGSVVEANTSGAVASFTNLPDGNYTYTVVAANGCQYSGTFTINPGPTCCTVTASFTPALCFGQASGTATANPANGVAPYTYVWYNAGMVPIGQTTQTATNLAAGTYNVTITDNTGCTATTSVTVTQPGSAVTATATTTNVTCFGLCNGQISVNPPSGGTPGYQYSLNGGAFSGTSTFTGLCPGAYTITVRDANLCTYTINSTITQPTDLTLSQISVTPATCGANNGAVTVSAGGGAVAYTYTIGASSNATGVFTGMASGSYTATVTDGLGCTETLPITIGSSAGPVPFVDVLTNVACAGALTGGVTIGVTGGTAPFQYQLDGGALQGSNSFNSVAAGAHTVTVTDLNGCTGTVNFTITQPTPLTFTSTPVAASCNGVCDGQITVNASNATPPYEYSSNNGLTFQPSNILTGLCAGNINVVVKDANGCLANAVVVITQPPVLTLTNGFVDPQCHQTPTGEISFTPGGGTPGYTYSVDNGATFTGTSPVTGLMAGVYDVVVEDSHGCQTTNTVTLTDPPPFTFNFIANNPSNCGAQDGSFEIIATAGLAPYIYTIGGTPQVNDGFFGGLFSGLYNLVVSDANGCVDSVYSALSDNVMITQVDVTVDATCYNGTDGLGIVSQTFGAAPFTYSITPGATVNGTGVFPGLSADTYYVTIQDAGLCLGIQQFTINHPDSVIATLSSVDVTCNAGADGQINVTGVTGGDGGPYQYSIDGGATYQAGTNFSGLAAGTYTITVMDGNGCLGTVTIDVDEPTPFNVIINATDLTCNGNNSGFAQIVASGSNGTPYTYQFGASTNGTGIFPALAANTYNVIVTDPLGCTYTTTQTINQPAPLAAAYTVTDALCNGVCDGEVSVVANGGTAPYLYSADGGITLQSGSNLTGLCAGTQNIYVVDDNNCSITAVQTVNEPTALSFTTTITPSTCGLPNGEIQVNAAGGTPVYNYSNNGGVSFQAGSTFTALASNNYNVIVEDDNGCQVTSLEFVPAEAAPMITGIAVSNVTCNGACDGSFVITANGGTGTLDYDIGGALQSGNTFNSVCPNTYTITVTDDNGCVDTQVETITEPTLLSYTSVLTNLTCNGDNSGEIDLNAAGGTSPYTYSFDGGATYIVQDISQFIAAGTYNVAVQDDNGCTVTGTETITEPAALAITAQNDVDASCYGLCDGSATLTISGGTGAYNYNWAGGVAGAGSNTATNLCAGGYTVDVTDANGCLITGNFVVDQPTMLGFTSVAGTDISCNGVCDGTITIYALNATGYSIDNGATFVAGNTFTGLCGSVGGTVYDLVIQNAAGCTQAQQITLYEPTPVVQDPITDITMCYDGSGVISSNATGGTPGYYYVWNTGDTAQYYTVNLTTPTTFTCTVYDIYGCVSNVQDVDVSIIPPFYQTTTLDTITLCPGDDETIAANGFDGVPAYTYAWLDSNLDSIATGSSFTYTPTTAGSIYVVGTDQCQWTDTTEIIVNFNGIPVPTLTVDPAVGCAPLLSNFVNTTPLSMPGSATWTFGNGNSATGDNVSNWYNDPGCYDVTLTVTSVDGCVGTSTFDDLVCVNPNPVAGFYWQPYDPTTLNPTITIVDISNGAVFYQYNFGGVGTSLEQNPEFTFPNVEEETVFEVCQVVTSVDGCTDTVCADVTIYEEIFFYVPNVITPDGDPHNQVFKPVMTSGIDMYDYHLTIFNRWGEIVFESYNYDFGWDGTYGDKGLVEDGVYIWQIEFGEKLSDKKQKHRGHVTVLK